MINFIKEGLNPHGRWNRKKFILYPLYFSISTIFIIVLSGYFIYYNLLWEDNLKIILFMVIYIICGIIYNYIYVLSHIKRLRDLDKNPWMVLLYFVPLANIYLLIICTFIKGTIGPNKFGPDPLGVNNQNNIVEIEKNNNVTTTNPEIKPEQKIEL